jgi:hypothetical protein
MKLIEVNNRKVGTVDEMVASSADCTSVRLCFLEVLRALSRGPSAKPANEEEQYSQSRESEVVVCLARHSFASWVCWGLCFAQEDSSGILLESCAKGSIAVGSAGARGCVGMFLGKINGVPVSSREAVSSMVDNVLLVRFHFYRRCPAGGLVLRDPDSSGGGSIGASALDELTTQSAQAPASWKFIGIPLELHWIPLGFHWNDSPGLLVCLSIYNWLPLVSFDISMDN